MKGPPMLFYRCDRCGCDLKPGALRYEVTIEVKAAYDALEIRLADLLRDHRDEMRRLIAAMDRADGADAVEEGVYKRFALHLCPPCQRAYIAAPLGEGGGVRGEPGVDIDGFLRSLGIRPPDGADEG